MGIREIPSLLFIAYLSLVKLIVWSSFISRNKPSEHDENRKLPASSDEITSFFLILRFLLLIII